MVRTISKYIPYVLYHSVMKKENPRRNNTVNIGTSYQKNTIPLLQGAIKDSRDTLF
jgi:hypothetical protein